MEDILLQFFPCACFFVLATIFGGAAYLFFKLVIKESAESVGEISLPALNATLNNFASLQPLINTDLSRAVSLKEDLQKSCVSTFNGYVKGNSLLLDDNGQSILIASCVAKLVKPMTFLITARINGKSLTIQNEGYHKFNFLLDNNFFGSCDINSLTEGTKSILSIYDSNNYPVFWMPAQTPRLIAFNVWMLNSTFGTKINIFNDSQLANQSVLIEKNHYRLTRTYYQRSFSSINTPNTIKFLDANLDENKKLLILAYYLVETLYIA